MDEKYSEQLLGFQRVSREAYMEELRKRHRLRSLSLLPLRPLLSRALKNASPYLGKNPITPGPTVWADACQVYEIPPGVAQTRSSTPPPPAPF
jgi:hypothetical protein